jgi:hypothetical protein
MANTKFLQRISAGVGLVVLAIAIRWFVFSPEFANGVIWKWLVYFARARWGIATIVGPTLVTVAALTVGRKLLYPVLVTRPSTSRVGIDPWTGKRFPRLMVDLFMVTALSLLMAVLGIAITHTVLLHGNERFGEPQDLLLREEPTAELPQAVPAVQANANQNITVKTHKDETKPIIWNWFQYSVWLGFGSVFPIAMLFISAKQHSLPIPPVPGVSNETPPRYVMNLVWGIIGIGAGFVLAAAFLLFVSTVQRTVFGSESLRGLLPFDSWLRDAASGKPEWWIGEQFRRAMGRVFDGPGYTDAQKRIYPAHLEMVVASIFAMTIYVSWWIVGHRDKKWTNSLWPSGFYVLLLLAFLQVQLGGLAFFLDRFGLPSSVVVLGWVVLMYAIFKADNFYAIDPQLTKGESEERDKALQRRNNDPPEHNANRPLGLNLAIARAALNPSPPARLYWKDALKNWKFPAVGSDGKRTMVVVTASGGGIQASAWTAKVLTELDKYEGFSESIGMISAVSGGSVGSMYYLCHRGLRKNDPSQQLAMDLSPEQQGRILLSACGPALEAVSWGVTFPDLARTLFPPIVDKYEDRGWALESASWNRLGPCLATGNDRTRLLEPLDRYLMADLRLRDFIRPFNDGQTPAVIFNATSVETGQRVLFSTVDLSRQAGIGSESHRTAKKAAELVINPIDWYSLYDAGNPRLTTAVRLSASFSFVAPVARAGESENKERMHLCDGGYSSNSGLVTAIRAIDRLLEESSDNFTVLPFDRVLIVSIAPYAAATADLREGGNGFVAQATGPQAALANVRVSSQAERDQLELELLLKKYANWENATPVSAVTLRFDVSKKDREGKTRSATPPLSWNLIPSAAVAIDEAWRNIASPQPKLMTDAAPDEAGPPPASSIRPTRAGFKLFRSDASENVQAREKEIMLESLADLEKFFPKKPAK